MWRRTLETRIAAFAYFYAGALPPLLLQRCLHWGSLISRNDSGMPQPQALRKVVHGERMVHLAPTPF